MFGKIGPLVLLLAGCWQASAGTVYIVLNVPPPVSGHQLVGAPGDTVGWGFTVVNNSAEWLVFTGSSLTESAVLGPSGTSTGYTDFMGINGGNDIAEAIPFMDPNTSWGPVTFDSSSLSGIGDYVIDPGTPLSSEDQGTFSINYDAYPCDPNGVTCSADNPGQTLNLQNDTLPTFDIFVQLPASGVPEPSTALPLGLLALGYAGVQLRRRFAK